MPAQIKSRNEIIMALMNDSKLKEAASNNLLKNYQKKYSEDLLQELYLHLLELPESKFNHIQENDYLFFYCLNFFSKQTGKNGSFNRQYFQMNKMEWNPLLNECLEDSTEKEKEKDEEYIEFKVWLREQEKERVAIIQNIINKKLHWYDKRVIEHWLEEAATTRSLSELWNIPVTSIHDTLTKIKKIIKKELALIGKDKLKRRIKK